ncbi:YceI family protein [Streptantibioticus rubrisoli]|jgi:polyisoprenoid-binding protein YceI|uniref:YceI family protein n=1 Tax=Streptantibioticus rubrisoli TaxID=1387313 RepID=A0ABT1PB54_9ACTN|nr:YceI family protein [Streptantibioticus rubrisoli]MCQ4041473.1 YceI family protein [Streptantibioticus rubrisoli]
MSSASAATRTLGGVELPAAGEWKLDPGHAEVGFVGRHFMMTKVRGRFHGVDSTILVGERPEDSKVTAVIDIASLDTGDKSRDDHLKSADFFDVEKFPKATFTSTSVTWQGTSGSAVGDLTIKDVTRPVTLQIDYLGYARDPWDNDRIVFSAKGKVNREEWGLTWNMVLESGGLMVSKEIELVLEFEAIRQA